MVEVLLLQGSEQTGKEHTDLDRQVDPVGFTRDDAQGLQAAKQARLREEGQACGTTPRKRPVGPLVHFEHLGLRGVLLAAFGTTLLRA